MKLRKRIFKKYEEKRKQNIPKRLMDRSVSNKSMPTTSV